MRNGATASVSQPEFPRIAHRSLSRNKRYFVPSRKVSESDRAALPNPNEVASQRGRGRPHRRQGGEQSGWPPPCQPSCLEQRRGGKQRALGEETNRQTNRERERERERERGGRERKRKYVSFCVVFDTKPVYNLRISIFC